MEVVWKQMAAGGVRRWLEAGGWRLEAGGWREVTARWLEAGLVAAGGLAGGWKRWLEAGTGGRWLEAES